MVSPIHHLQTFTAAFSPGVNEVAVSFESRSLSQSWICHIQSCWIFNAKEARSWGAIGTVLWASQKRGGKGIIEKKNKKREETPIWKLEWNANIAARLAEGRTEFVVLPHTWLFRPSSSSQCLLASKASVLKLFTEPPLRCRWHSQPQLLPGPAFNNLEEFYLPSEQARSHC